MRKPAKLTSSFWLLLKQGFRGLFKFKVQFSIILILSFLATLILTISVGTTRHLQSNFNQIVGVIPRFSYSATTQIDSTATQNKGAPLAQYEPMPLVDFANNAPVSALTLEDVDQVRQDDSAREPQVSEAVSNYNFILNDDLYRDQLGMGATTFITKFMKDSGDYGFYGLTQKALSDPNRRNLDDQYIRDVGRALAWRLIVDISNYQQKALQSSLINQGGQLVDFQDLTYLQTTSIGFLVANQPHFLDFLLSWQSNSGQDPTKLNPEFFDQLPYYQKQFINYVYWNGILFGNWLATEFQRYVRINQVPTTDVLYEYFLGVPKEGDSYTQQGYYLKAAKGVIHEASDERYLMVVENNQADATDQKTIDQAIVKKGFKGMTSPLIIQINSERIISNITFTNFYQSLSLRDHNASAIPFNKELHLMLNFNTIWNPALDYGNWQPWSYNAKAATYQYHLQLTALASGFTINFRKESLFFDTISARKFRYVVQNGFDYANFTILEGSRPSATGEVAISEQFARFNKIKIGDYLAIGQTEVMVVGYGTDSYSFMPIVDTTVPIPEPKTGAFVYGSAQTLKHIKDGFGGGSANQDLTPYYYNFFLTSQINTWIREGDKFNLFKNLQMDLAQNLAYNLANLENLKPHYYAHQTFQVANDGSEIVVPPKDVDSFWKLDDFDNSPYNLNWTILPLALRALKIVTYIASGVIALIALIALAICINKTIIATSKQMGILKSMGLGSWKIAVTYLAYGLVIMFIVVPISWALGLACEIPFIYLFGIYFSIQWLTIDVAWPAFLIAFFGFGILAVVLSLVAAYLVLRRPVLEIFDISVKWSASRFFDFLKNQKLRSKSFSVRFSLTLASAGIRPILLLTTVIFLTSLFISTVLTIPAIANGAISSYYKNVHYANSYTNMAPTVNSPLSKPSIAYWEGNEVWDRDWVPNALKLDSTNNKYGYYRDPRGYSDSISQNMVIPRYLYNPEASSRPSLSPYDGPPQLYYSYVFVAQNQGDFLRYVSQIFGDNFFTVLGQGFSIGMIDQFLGLILNADENFLKSTMGNDYEAEKGLDWNKQKFCIAFMDSLAQGLPNIISQIIGAVNGSITPSVPGLDTNWKDQIVSAILTQVPPYIRNYIYKSPSRLEQFGIFYNSESYTPKKESVFTEVIADSQTHKGLSLIGLDSSQNAFSIPASLKQNIFLENQELIKIEEILNGDYSPDNIFWRGINIWNKETQVLTIPFLANKQARSSYHFDKNPILNDITTFGRQLKYRTNTSEGWEVIPRGAWIYDDTQFINANVYQNPSYVLKAQINDSEYQNAYLANPAYLSQSSSSTKSYLDLYALDNNKFTYANLYQDKQLNRGAYMFNDFALDETNQLASSYVRPYYMYRNIQLYLPLNRINLSDILSSMQTANQGVGANDLGGDHPWYEIMDAREVPHDVLQSWGQQGGQYLMLRPYDINYVAHPPQGIDRITNGTEAKYWFRYALDKELGPGALTYENNEPIRYGRYGENSPLKINLQNVGTLNSYDSRLIIIDSSLANLLNRYSLSRAYAYTNSLFELGEKGKSSSLPSKSFNNQPWPDKLATYPIREAAQDAYVSRENLNRITYLEDYEEANNLAPLRWNNGKYSNINEPESLTSSVSFNVIDNLGQNSLGLMYPEGLGTTTLIKNQTLLSTQRALINQIFLLSISLAVLLIVAIVITGSLLIMLMGDIYIAQYQNFMILMRALGYANWEIQTYAFSVVSLLSFVAWVGATVVAWAIVFGIIRAISNLGVAIPYGLSWWPIIVSLFIIVTSFLGSLWVSSYKVRHDPVSILMSEN